MKLTAIFEEAKEGGYVCWIEQIPEVLSQGDTLLEAKQNLIDAFNLMMEYRHEESETTLSKLKSENIYFTKETLKLA